MKYGSNAKEMHTFVPHIIGIERKLVIFGKMYVSFVYICQPPSIKKILKSIVNRVNISVDWQGIKMDEIKQIIKSVHSHLFDKLWKTCMLVALVKQIP